MDSAHAQGSTMHDEDGGAEARADRVEALRAALRLEQLVLHYQPVVDLLTGRTAGFEALVRWQQPGGRLLPPLEFVPLAEESGLIGELGDWVLRTAGAQAATWAAAGRVLDVAVNLSPLQLTHDGAGDHVLALLDAVGAPRERIVLEVTESALLDARSAADALWGLREAGVRLALDDFGTGYASFSSLRQFPVDVLKVDASFTRGLGVHPDDDAIVAAIVSLAARTSKVVVAEGVETPAQARLLRDLGVGLAQGFLWTPALPQHQLSGWLGTQVDPAPGSPPSLHLRTDDAETAEACILRMHAAGSSVHTIAAALNVSGRRTLRGARWHNRSVSRFLEVAVRASA